MTELKSNTSNVSFGKSLYRYQITALLATVADIGMLSLLHYVFGVHYAIATALGAASGAILAFYLGRVWCFENQDGSVSKQAFRFLVMSVINLIITTGGVVVLVEYFKMENVLLAKLLIAAFVGVGINFPLQRYYVYK